MSENSALLNLVAELASGRIRVVDLTQPLSPETPVIQLPPGIGASSPPLSVDLISRFDENGPAWYWNVIRMGEHTGTHFDAPNHWISGREYANGCTDSIPPERLVAPAYVIDCSADAAADADFLLTPERIEEWEAGHDRIQPNSWVLMRTDWSKREGDAFLNIADDGPHSPGWTPDCVKFLVEQRDVIGVGVETVGTDAGQAGTFDPPFPCHHLMHGANKYGLASLANLDKLPPTGAVLIAPPLKLVGGSGSPLRVLALVPA
ncbi:MAG: cyclase family protein [Sphingomonadales bacterium]